MNTIALLQSADAQSAIFNLVLFGGLFVIIYFIVIAPANKARKKTAELLSSLKKGDRVVTSGGIYGTIQGVEGEVVFLRIAENVKVRIARSAVTGLVSGEAGE